MFKYFITKWLWLTLGVLKGIFMTIASLFAAFGVAFVFSENFRKDMIKVSKKFDETSEEQTTKE